jgi:zinc transport system substrate-binding protein
LGDRADDVNLTMLLDNGTDLHSFQPAVKDIMKVSSCDLLIYVGGESDQWIEDALESAQNKDMKTINLMEVLGDSIKEEETVEGMQESEHDHDHEDEEEKEYDEHVWTSMRNAEVICDAIAETLEEMDPENKEIYQSNAEVYKEKLSALDEGYKETVNNANQKTLVFADRFPFRYLVDDYDLSYYAAFSGCSAESEASFKTVTFLAGKVDELGVKSVLTMEKSDDRIAQTVIENTKAKDQKILQLNSMQSITSEEIADGATYLSVMEDNLGVLKEALN